MICDWSAEYMNSYEVWSSGYAIDSEGFDESTEFE